jgi:hypothetical protein
MNFNWKKTIIFVLVGIMVLSIGFSSQLQYSKPIRQDKTEIYKILNILLDENNYTDYALDSDAGYGIVPYLQNNLQGIIYIYANVHTGFESLEGDYLFNNLGIKNFGNLLFSISRATDEKVYVSLLYRAQVSENYKFLKIFSNSMMVQVVMSNNNVYLFDIAKDDNGKLKVMVVYDISQVWNTMYLKYRYQG